MISRSNLSAAHLAWLQKIALAAQHARRYSLEKRGTLILASTCIAQAVRETGYGEDDLSRDANNFFGIKAGPLYLGAKVVLKTTEPYGRHLEVYGLASWIGVFGGIITLVMMLAMNSIYATPSAALAIYDSFDPANKTHGLLRALDLFGAWQAVVAGFGISRVAGKDSMMGIIVTVGLWLIWVAISVALGLAR